MTKLISITPYAEKEIKRIQLREEKDNPWNKLIDVTNHGHTLHFKTDFAIHNMNLDDVIQDLIKWRNDYEEESDRWGAGVAKLVIECTGEDS